MHGFVLVPHHGRQLALRKLLIEDLLSSPVSMLCELSIDVAAAGPHRCNQSDDRLRKLANHFHGRNKVGVIGYGDHLVDFVSYGVAERVQGQCDVRLLLLELPHVDDIAFTSGFGVLPEVSSCRSCVEIAIDDLQLVAEVAAKACVVVGLAGDGIVGSCEGGEDRGSKVFDGRCFEFITDRRRVSFVQDARENALDERARVEPFVRGALEATVVQVVPVDLDSRPERVFYSLLHQAFWEPDVQKPPRGGFCARSLIRSCRTGRTGKLRRRLGECGDEVKGYDGKQQLTPTRRAAYTVRETRRSIRRM